MFLLIIVFLTLTFCGFVLWVLIDKSIKSSNSKNTVLITGASIILGQLGFIFFLEILSYMFKGIDGIRLIFFLYIAFVAYLAYRNGLHRTLFKHFSLKLGFNSFACVIIIALYAWLLFQFAANYVIGGDSNLYWGIATSFTRGNYPTVLPWQPNFLTVYHEGTYILEGALVALTSIGISTIQKVFTAYILLGIFLFVTGICREKTKSLLSFLPAIFGLILFGGPIVPIDHIGHLISNSLIWLFPNQPLTSDLFDSYPGYWLFRNGSGSAANSLHELFYANFYSHGLAVFFVFLYLLFIQSKNKFNRNKYLTLTVVAVLMSSIDESLFIIGIVIFSILLVFQISILPRKKVILNLSLLLFVFVAFFMVIQNPIRDSLLTPVQETPRFKIAIIANLPILNKYFYSKDQHIIWNGQDTLDSIGQFAQKTLDFAGGKVLTFSGVNWVIADSVLFIFIILILSIFLKLRFVSLISIASLISLIFSLLIINTYWPPNHLRFVNYSSNLIMYAFGILLLELYISKKKYMKILVTAILVIMLPQTIAAHARFYHEAFIKPAHFDAEQPSPSLVDLAHKIPYDKKIIFIEGYPKDQPAPYLSFDISSKMGLFVPFSDPRYKVMNPSMDMAWYDAVNTLSPYAFKELNIDFIFVEKRAFSRLTPIEIKNLNNITYFEPIQDYGEGVLLKVNEDFKNLQDEEDNMRHVMARIGIGKRIYVDKLYLNELREMFIMNLSKTNRLAGHEFAHSTDFPMYVETETPFIMACRRFPCSSEDLNGLGPFDIAVMNPDRDPNMLFKDKYKKIHSVLYVDIWERFPD
jgi:hypothetical protein